MILNEVKYPKERIEAVKRCILNHRGSVLKEKTKVEEICVSDGDAISHFDNIPSLFYLAFEVKKYSCIEGKEFVKNKLIRSYNKLSESTKKIYKDKYKSRMEIFE